MSILPISLERAAMALLGGTLALTPCASAQGHLRSAAADAPPMDPAAPTGGMAWNSITFDYNVAGQPAVTYRIPLHETSPAGERMRDGQLEVFARVDGGQEFQVVSMGGVRYRQQLATKLNPCDADLLQEEVLLEPDAFAALGLTEYQSVDVPQDHPDSVEVCYSDELPGGPRTRVYRFSLEGRALRVDIEDRTGGGGVDASGYYAGFSPGVSAATPGVFDVVLPRTQYPVGVFKEEPLEEPRFFGCYTEPWEATTLEFAPYRRPAGADSLGVGMWTRSAPDTDGQVPVFRETVYVVASDSILDVAPHSTHDALDTDARDDLDQRVFVDWRTQLAHQQFGGTEIAWRPPPNVANVIVDVSVTYQRVPLPVVFEAEQEVRLAVRHVELDGTRRTRLDHTLTGDAVETASWTGVEVKGGTELSFRIDPSGYNWDRGLLLEVQVDFNGTLYSLAGDFSGQQGPNWYHRKYMGAVSGDMHWDANANQWIAWPVVSPPPPMGITSFLANALGGQDALLVSPTYFRYLATEQWYRRLWDLGLRDLAAVDHIWQQHGFDQLLPDIAPAFPPYQSDLVFPVGQDPDELRRAMLVAQQLGFLVGLHENYHLVDDEWAGYTSDLTAQDSFGCGREFGKDLTILDVLALDKAKSLALAEQPEVGAYVPGAVYIDIGTAERPGYGMDLAASNPTETSSREALRLLYELWKANADAYGGPLFGEGGHLPETRFPPYYAGAVHGAGGDSVSGRFLPCLVDHELRHVRPLMVNQGMGAIDRYQPLSPLDPRAFLQTEDWDRYHLQSLLYGHTAWLGSSLFESLTQLYSLDDVCGLYFDQYHAIRAAQEAYLPRQVTLTDVQYLRPEASSPVGLSTLLAEDEDLSSLRVHSSFSNGTQVYGNFNTGRRVATPKADFSATQGRLGWRALRRLASGMDVELKWSPEDELYRFKNSLLSLDRAYSWGMPLVWEYTAPMTASYELELFVDFLGHPAQVSIEWGTGQSVSESSAVGVTYLSPGSASTPLQLSEGERVRFVYDPVDQSPDPMSGNPQPRAIFVPIVERVPAQADGAWDLSSPSGDFCLPPYGYLVTGSNLLAFSADIPGQGHIDYVDGANYEYVRSRSGALVHYQNIGSDGSASITEVDLPGVGLVEELHLMGGRQLVQGGESSPPILELSKRGSCQVLRDDATTLRFQPDFIEQDSLVRITYRGLAGVSMQGAPSVWELEPEDGVERWMSSVWDPIAETLVINRAHQGWSYRVRWTPAP